MRQDEERKTRADNRVLESALGDDRTLLIPQLVAARPDGQVEAFRHQQRSVERQPGHEPVAEHCGVAQPQLEVQRVSHFLREALGGEDEGLREDRVGPQCHFVDVDVVESREDLLRRRDLHGKLGLVLDDRIPAREVRPAAHQTRQKHHKHPVAQHHRREILEVDLPLG